MTRTAESSARVKTTATRSRQQPSKASNYSLPAKLHQAFYGAMKEYYSAWLYYTTYTRHVPVIYLLTLHVLPVQQEALPNHRVHQQLIRNSAYRAYNTRGRNYRPPDTFHLIRATTAQPDELTRCGRIIHPPYTTMGLQQLRLQ